MEDEAGYDGETFDGMKYGHHVCRKKSGIMQQTDIMFCGKCMKFVIKCASIAERQGAALGF
ncbi:hypothetical protein GCM10007063_31980 [Lentibacillus kapialis]|uniref:Uncharacterized protein n=1 Tax=Lentibacillus kapialis TaxID=340214 RepID=A0A917Q2D4_9BACI|nr:hypothetical protein GCM10007063_31980 [Lentibacillus kapialis]